MFCIYCCNILTLCLLLCLDIDERGEVIEEDRPSGADAEHRQGAKTINADCQKRKQADKRARELVRRANESEVNRNIICKILEANNDVEKHLKSETESDLLEDASVALFLLLTSHQLKYFIHARKFSGKSSWRRSLPLLARLSRRPVTEDRRRIKLKEIAMNPIPV